MWNDRPCEGRKKRPFSSRSPSNPSSEPPDGHSQLQLLKSCETKYGSGLKDDRKRIRIRRKRYQHQLPVKVLNHDRLRLPCRRGLLYCSQYTRAGHDPGPINLGTTREHYFPYRVKSILLVSSATQLPSTLKMKYFKFSFTCSRSMRLDSTSI
jgi:hypothetical protein